MHQQIIEIIAQTLGVEDISEITRDSEFIADLNGSLEEVQSIIKSVEDKFDIELGISDPEELISVSQLLDLSDEALI